MFEKVGGNFSLTFFLNFPIATDAVIAVHSRAT